MTQEAALRELTEGKYKYGFVTDVETDEVRKGPRARRSSASSAAKEGEPGVGLLDLPAEVVSPLADALVGADLGRTSTIAKIDTRDIRYYSAPKKKGGGAEEEKLGPPEWTRWTPTG